MQYQELNLIIVWRGNQKGLNLTISFEDDEGTNEVDGIIIIQEIKYMRVNFTIEGAPVGKARPIVTRTVTYTPAKTARYEDLVRYTAINSFKGIFDKDEPLDVKIMAYFEVPKSLSKKRKALCLSNQELPTKKPDADNVGKIIMDGMNPKMKRDKRLHKMVEVMRGIYHDDKQVTTLLVKKRYAERARVDVRIKRDMGDQMNDEFKLGGKLCFVNLIFKNGCTDSIAVKCTKEHIWNLLSKEFDEYGQEIKNRILIIDGIHEHVYLDLSTVATMGISENDKSPYDI